MTLAFAQDPSPAVGDVHIRHLSKRFAAASGSVLALHDIDLRVGAGRILAIVGSSGCGKSTLLRILAGLEDGYEGLVTLDGTPLGGPSLARGVVFQDHRLLPWLTVEQNIAFGLSRLSRLSRGERADRVARHLHLVGLEAFARAYPHQLSGGMAQRVAIARALAHEPSLLLLDEPFGALDAMTKLRLQDEMLRIWEARRTTLILVTHDIEEAIYLGDEVVVMSPRPGTIRTVLPVALPRPRDRSSPHFIALRQQILQLFFAQAEAPFAYSI